MSDARDIDTSIWFSFVSLGYDRTTDDQKRSNQGFREWQRCFCHATDWQREESLLRCSSSGVGLPQESNTSYHDDVYWVWSDNVTHLVHTEDVKGQQCLSTQHFIM